MVHQHPHPCSDCGLVLRVSYIVCFYSGFLPTSSDELMDLEAYCKWEAGQTIHEFIKERQPELNANGVFCLNEPDGLPGQVNDVGRTHTSFSFRDLDFRYVGDIFGTGPVFALSYQEGS